MPFEHNSSVVIEPAHPNDLDAVAALVESSSSWTKETFWQDVKLSWSRLLIARLESGEITSFCVYWIVADEIHILNIATHEAHRRKGYARRILEKILQEAKQKNCLQLSLEVRISNLPAQVLYQSFGFQSIACRKNYYTDQQEDALIMLLKLS